MTETEQKQLEKLKRRLGMTETSDEQTADLEGYLEDAKWIIFTYRFPGGVPENQTEVEPQYLNLQIRIAVELYDKEGAEGQTAHSENGINRTYENASVSNSLLAEITPKVIAL